MKRVGLAACVAAALPLSTSSAQQPAFRSSVDFVELDVFVTDGRGTFVKGLTADDFEVLDDGSPQSVSTFSFVDLPISPPTTSSMPELDVVMNAGSSDERLWVMLLDAPTDFDRGATYTRRTQNAARHFIESIGPSDSVAVVHVQGTQRSSQPLTTSRARLFASIERFSQGTSSGGPEPSGVPRTIMPRGQEPFEQITRTRTTFQVIQDVAERLGRISSRRKALIWIGGQMPFDLQRLSPQLLFAYQEMIRAAQRNHVVIYSIDPYGLVGNTLEFQASLRVIAEDTGGMAVVGTNDFTRGFREIVRDNSSYYLVGYYPNPIHRDGEFHPITVRVKRPGLTVRARRGYLAPAAAAVPKEPSTPVDELAQALRNPIPRRDVSIDVAATPLGSVKTAGSVLLTAYARAEQAAAPADSFVDVAVRVISDEGQTLAERATRYPLVGGRADASGRVGIRFTDRIDLPKGRQEIRVAINMPGDKTGSVVTYVDVPDFTQSRLSLSGLRIERAADQGIPVFAGGGSEASDAAVTTERRFPSSATLRVRGSVYGKLDRADDTLAVTAQLRNAAGAAVRESLPVTIEAGGRIPQERVAYIQLPLSGLEPGPYTLVVNAGAARNRRLAATRELTVWVAEQ